MNSVYVVLVAVLCLAAFPFWYKKRKAVKKRVWRSVKVTSLTRIKHHKTGPLELLGEPSMVASYQYQNKEYACQMAFRENLWFAFVNHNDAHILIDPNNPSQCFHNAEQAYRFAKWWLWLALVLLICLSVVSL
jgi:hypothetical protein